MHLSPTEAREIAWILDWTEPHVQPCQRFTFWESTTGRCTICHLCLDQRECDLHLEVFNQICLYWGTPDVDLLPSRLNQKGPRLSPEQRILGPL